MNRSSVIYVAGHRGMVGSAIIRNLQAREYTNIVTRTHGELDLTRQNDVEAFFDTVKPEYVFLAAAKVGGILANNTYKADFIYENMMIAANVIHAAYLYGVKKLINLGSSCIYPKFAPQPMSEDCLLTGMLEPTNEPYAVAKIAAIKLCRYYNDQYKTNFMSAMPTNLYGPNDNYNLETSHVLPALIRKFHLAKLLEKEEYDLIKTDLQVHGISHDQNTDIISNDDVVTILSKNGIHKQYVTLWGSGSPYREFLHADDLAEACVFLMLEYNAKDIGELINIGTGVDIRIKDLTSVIKEVVGFAGDVRWDLSKPDGAPKKLLYVEKLHKLGWKSKIDLRDGIKLTYENYER
ncbi:MAG: GDP-L-fucose synthase [Nitrospiraceae bacterium]|nr:MAG: GDP-L-fucose synthase [Nitrospiraceae bacterium]